MAARMFGSRGRGARRLPSRPRRGVFEVLEGRALLATLQFPTTLSGAAGDTIRVPLNLDVSDNLDAVDVAISYDTTRLEVLSNSDVQRGTVTSDFSLFQANVDNTAGTIRVGSGRDRGRSPDAVAAA